ncbi:ABC transporter permease [Flavitalea sp. BT771]|uniref:ABC transporter permease n=1 Tax=Flavitalea sp. BT771 TaxID=3063329 RepID=UPI0026E19E7F|nr:ABC transporter permease [Flavitalea sp. BT771]MDO6432798.1 ABC transporter permease [Flavitalea sp. BT771]MDV6221926.1 FtsX-like permease family protein [Flavitalea sp. BT771]
MSNHQLRSAVRFLARHKGYAGINILGLTLGLCACLVIYHIVSYEFSFDRAYPGRDRIYRVGCRIRIDNGNGVINEGYGKSIPAPAPAALLAEVPHIETLAAYYPYNVSITIPPTGGSGAPVRLEPKGANPFISTTIIASGDYFNIFPYTWLAGNPVQSLSQPYSVVLTASRARDYFGHLPADQYIGRALIYDDSLHVRVSGIISDYEGNTDFPNTDFISFPTISHSFLKDIFRHDLWRFNLGVPGIQAFVKLSKNANATKTAALFDTILQRHIANDAFLRLLKLNMVLQPLGDVHFNAAYDNDGIRKANRPALYGLMGAAVFILLLAIVNFINLSTAQALQQAKDMGIRRILGATRRRLMGRSLTETAILTTLSAIIALALFRPALALFHNYLPEGLPFNPFSPAVLFFVVGSSIVTTFLAGLYPAISLVRLQLSQNLQPQNTRRFTLRRVLIVFQFSISLLFIITSLVVGRQINYMLDADMGFSSSAVVTVAGLNASPQQIRLFARQALGIPGVQETTLQGHAPAGVQAIQNPLQLDHRTDNKLEVHIQPGDRQFIPFYHIRLLAGRNLSSGDSLRAFVINDTYRKALGFSKPADALGHTLTWQGKTLPIVGVVADFHTSSLHTAIPALVIVRAADRDNSVGLRIASTDHQTLSRLETLWKNLLPDLPFTYTFLDDSIARLYQRDRQLSWLVGISTATTIFVSCIGLLGLTLFIVERKKKEVSIRKVLGAGVAHIVFLLNKEFLMLAGIALVIASPIAFLGMHRWLQNFAYRVTISWWIFVLAGLIIVAISVLTISLRVFRAARTNPTENLRSE